jgi:hypothetical protein
MRARHLSRAIEAEIASIAGIVEEVGARKDRGDTCIDFMVTTSPFTDSVLGKRIDWVETRTPGTSVREFRGPVG